MPAIIERRLEREEDLTMGGLLELLDGAALQYNFQLLYLSQPNTKVLPTEFFKKHEKSCAVLEREGVMKIQIGSVEFGDSVLSVAWLELTKFGFDFVWACNGYVEGTSRREFQVREKEEKK